MDTNTKLMVKQAHQVYLAHKLLEKTSSALGNLGLRAAMLGLQGGTGAAIGGGIGAIGGAASRRDDETMLGSIGRGARKGALIGGLGNMGAGLGMQLGGAYNPNKSILDFGKYPKLTALLGLGGLAAGAAGGNEIEKDLRGK